MSLTLQGIIYTRFCFVFTLCLNNTALLLSLILHLFRGPWYGLCFYPFLLHVKNLTIHGSIDVMCYHPPPLCCAVSSLMPQRLLQGTLKDFALSITTQAAVFLPSNGLKYCGLSRSQINLRYKQGFLLFNLNGLNPFSLCLVFLLDSALFQPDGINCSSAL